MRLILLGPPGSGKGTQALLLSQRLGICHISTGDLLREAIRQDTVPGRQVAPYLAAGKLVPDSMVNDIIKARFSQGQRPEHFVLDGYPRTVPQAAALHQLLLQEFLKIDTVILLLVSDEEIVQRISGRLICPNSDCGASYHLTKKPPRVPGICDLCASSLLQRPDDKEGTVRRRLQLFHQNNNALLDYYKDQGLLRVVPAVGNIEAIYSQVVTILEETQGT